MPFNILISSCGRRGALVGLCRRALTDLGLSGRVLGADITKASAAYQLCDAGFYATRFDDPAFIPKMLEICQQQSVGLVIPTHDQELILYANAYDQFESIGTRVVIPSPEVVTIGSDKEQTHRWLTEHHLPAPRQTTPEQVLANPESWPLPLLIKPTFGSSSIGVHIIDDLEKLKRLSADRPCIVQTIARGQEYTVDLFVNQAGVCQCAVPRHRLETRAGEVSKGVTERNKTVIDLAMRACDKLPGARGVMNMQIFFDPITKDCKIIEINTRFGGGYPLTDEAGGKFISWSIEETMGFKSSASNKSWRNDLAMLRFDEAVFIDHSEIKA